MKIFSAILFLFIGGFYISTAAQPRIYTAANAHSHNDYNQSRPYFQAYNANFGSMEADIYLADDKLLVAHDADELIKSNTLQFMYLDPLNKNIQEHNGHVYTKKSSTLQLLIDIKTEVIVTLAALIKVLKNYPLIIHNKTIRIVITGNRPDAEKFKDYPDYIWFDGDADITYSKIALSRIAMLSDDFKKYTHWKGQDNLPDSATVSLQKLIVNAHALHKPIRFWGSPDFTEAWKKFIQLKVDFINTDHIEALAAFLKERNDSLNYKHS